MSKPQSATSLAVCGSYRTSAMEPSLIRSTASSMTKSGTRNHSRGTTAFLTTEPNAEVAANALARPRRMLLAMSNVIGSIPRKSAHCSMRWALTPSWLTLDPISPVRRRRLPHYPVKASRSSAMHW